MCCTLYLFQLKVNFNIYFLMLQFINLIKLVNKILFAIIVYIFNGKPLIQLINLLLIGSFRINYPIKFRCVSFDHHFTFSYLNKPKCVGTQNKTRLHRYKDFCL